MSSLCNEDIKARLIARVNGPCLRVSCFPRVRV